MNHDIQDIYRIYTGYIQDIYRIYTYRIYTGYIQEIYRIYTGYILAQLYNPVRIFTENVIKTFVQLRQVDSTLLTFDINLFNKKKAHLEITETENFD